MNWRGEVDMKNKAVVVVSVIIFVISLKAFWGNLSRLKKSLVGLREKEEIVSNLRKGNEEIRKKVEELSSDLYLEKQLRDNLGMAREGEQVIILPDDEELEALVPDLDMENRSEVKPIWQRWLEVFNFY